MDRDELTCAVESQFRRAEWALHRAREGLIGAIGEASALVADSLRTGGRLLVAGNGGSASDAQHLAAEFTGRLSQDRCPLPALSLATDTSALTAIANDYGFAEVFARQVSAHGRPGDVLIAISTSGRSPNILRALSAARGGGLATVLLTGSGPVEPGLCDLVIQAPSRETARIQEVHAVVVHALAQSVEAALLADLAVDASRDTAAFVLPAEALAGYRSWVERTGQTLVTTNGVFDLVHQGHVASLAAARSLGDRLVVLLNSDASARRLKGPSRPAQLVAERIAALRALPAVDHVAVMQGDDPRPELDLLRPHVHAKGQDYAGRTLPEAGVVEGHGGRVVLLPMSPAVSTTRILGST